MDGWKLPSWSELALIGGGIGGAAAWMDNRLIQGREARSLRKKIADAEAEVTKAKQAAEKAIVEKNTELHMIREDRDQWRDKARYWQDQAQHLETMLTTLKGGQS